MELRRAADALLRAPMSPLAVFLSPGANIRWEEKGQLRYWGRSNRQIQRSFTSSTKTNAMRPTATTTSTPPASADASPSNSDLSQPQPSVEDQVKSLGWTAPFRPMGSVPTLSPERERAMNGGSSASDLMETLLRRRPSSTMDIHRMQDIGPINLPSSYQSHGLQLGVHKPPRKPLILNPSTGRTVILNSATDLAKGIRQMEMSCARNKVKTDFMRQRFHERGGLKKKRLRRERWRVRFMGGFKATVARVRQLKRQGW